MFIHLSVDRRLGGFDLSATANRSHEFGIRQKSLNLSLGKMPNPQESQISCM